MTKLRALRVCSENRTNMPHGSVLLAVATLSQTIISVTKKKIIMNKKEREMEKYSFQLQFFFNTA